MLDHAIAVTCLDLDAFENRLADLAAILHRCVHDGASVGFIMPFGIEDSRKFWIDRVRPEVAGGATVLMVATIAGAIAGTVQLGCGALPNQRHRGEVSKLLVDPPFRRRGVARALMAELERQAAARGLSLLTLDTRTGDGAEPLYTSLGFETVGIIPAYCRDTFVERMDPTTIMFKRFEEPAAPTPA